MQLHCSKFNNKAKLFKNELFRQYRSLPLPSAELEDDEDVAEERERVLSGEADDDLVCLKNLTKVSVVVDLSHSF